MNVPKSEGQYAWKTAAREFAAKFAFQFFFKKNKDLVTKFSSNTTTLETEFESFMISYETPDEEHPSNHLSPQSRDLAFQIIKGITQNFNRLEESINSNLKSNWKISNIKKMDHALLLVGLYEIFETETPHQVVISEIVELAKIYGSQNSPPFINGILDAAAKG